MMSFHATDQTLHQLVTKKFRITLVKINEVN